MKLFKRALSSKLNLLTLLVFIIGIVLYFLGFNNYKNTYDAEAILSMTSDYFTVLSCSIVLIQLIAFVNDSRHKEFRSKKEAALNLAKEYAENLISYMTFIQIVLCINYNESSPKELYEKIDKIEIAGFRLEDLNKKSEYETYKDVFINEKNSVNSAIIINQSITSGIPLIKKIEGIDLEEKNLNQLCNIRFRVILCDTMNTLEYFAMAVNQNVAESEMLYDSIHQTFLFFVKLVYPFICEQNIDEELYYPNIIKLYKTWVSKKAKNDKMKLKSEQKKKKAIERKKNESIPL